MMNDRAANCWSCASVSKPLEEPVLPEMPFAPPEGDYGDDSETTENLEQFGHEQGRDTLVSASGSSGSSYQAGQMFMGTWRPKGGPKAVQRRYTVYYTNLYYLFFFEILGPRMGRGTCINKPVKRDERGFSLCSIAISDFRGLEEGNLMKANERPLDFAILQSLKGIDQT